MNEFVPPFLPVQKQFTRRDALKLGIMASLGCPLLEGCVGTRPAATSVPNASNLLALVRDPILEAALYRSPRLRDPQPSASGAISLNAQWEKGEAPRWFIDLQRYAGDLIQAGICSDDLSLVERAISLMRWGFAKQGPEGNFPGTGDPFHSTEVFVADTARGLLLLRLSGLPQYAGLVKTYTPQLQQAAHWLTRPDIAEPGRRHNASFTHRCYILAAALGISADLAGDADLAAAATVVARRGMQLQRADGVNPELGGFDVSYQSAGILFAARYFPSCKDRALQAGLAGMIRKGGEWLCGRLGQDGNLVVAGSTRVAGQEKQHWGKTKGVNYMEALQTFCHAGTITGEERFRRAARLIARTHAPINPNELV
jgi:hypothetical protein